MRKIFLLLLLLSVRPMGFTVAEEKQPIETTENQTDPYQLYTDMQLEGKVNFVAFMQAFTGYNKIEDKKKEIITLIDFTKPSSEERLFVLDMKRKKLLFSSVVSHGRNSGDLYATSFSNKNGSYKSSLGFFITENTYYGKNGYSLVLDGLEEGINDNAKERAIVIHGSRYVNPSVVAASGKLGRSLGCPAIPLDITRKVIDTIKDGSLLYIYANNQQYMAQSDYLYPNAEQV